MVALGTGGADECAIAGTTTSTGYNVGGDGSCAFTAGPGDLNTTPDTYPIKTLFGPAHTPGRLTPQPLADSRGERWTHFFAYADDYSRLDYFMTSNALSPAIDRAASGIDDSPAWNKASDHRAIFLTIRPAK